MALPWHWLGRLDYRTGVERQESARERLLAGDESAAGVFLLEHEPVITLGRRADPAHLLVARAALDDRGIDVQRTTRGGDITYHGPGQLVIYPVVRLRDGVVKFLRAIAEALADVAAQLGVSGARWQRDPAGLWLGNAKLAACGIHVRRGVCAHGFAFNVATPAEMWQLIVPCGLRDKRITSIADERRARGLPPPPPVAEVARMAAPILCAALDESYRPSRPEPGER